MASSAKLGVVSVELSIKLRGYWCDERRSVVSINRGRVGKSLYCFF